MRKSLVRLLCCFIPNRELRHRVRAAFRPGNPNENFIITGANNIIVTIDENGNETPLTTNLNGVKFVISGNNNTIKIHLPLMSNKSVIRIQNDNCYIEMGPSLGPFRVNIRCWAGDSQRIVIGKNTTIAEASIICNEQSGVLIGEDCMLSWNIRIWPADGHSILDAKSGNVLNTPSKPIIIGKHVWIAEGARITKNARIYDNSIIAGGCVACKDYKESGVIIAGNPGQIVKREITWDRINTYDRNRQKTKERK